jgi:alkanesulfonate monooxygenase SsuD/methylene tetrahydromethanopterin reductase-like flavin-dependent oxidoreductase (luciferase family)
VTRFGVELVTGYPVPKILELLEPVLDQQKFDYIGVTDNSLTSNVLVSLAAIAQRFDVSVGPLVTYPFARSPYELANAFSSISELNSKLPYIGIGAGGLLQQRLYNISNPLELTKETVVLLRKLFKGDAVDAGDYPALSNLFQLRKGVKSKLMFVPKDRIPVYVAAHGPKALAMTGSFADGLIIRSTSVGGLPGIRKGYLDRLIRTAEDSYKKSGNTAAFQKFYTTTFAIDEDEERAKKIAKGGISYQLGESLIGMDLTSLGVTASELEVMRGIRQAYSEGAQMGELIGRIPDSVVDKAFLIVGKPKKCVEEFAEVLKETKRFGVHHTLAFPVGSDLISSVKHLTERILPSI